MFHHRLIILVTVFLIHQGIPLNAQVSLGVNFGITRTTFSGDQPTNGSFGPELGPMAGLRFDYRFTQAVALSFQPGIMNQGVKYIKVDSNNDVTDSLKYKLNTLSFPIHAVIWSENGRFFVSAGLQFDYYVDAKAVYPDHSVDITSELKGYNIYAQFGGGFILSLGRPYILFELRYSQGLVDLNNPIFHDEGYLPRTKLTGLSFMAGFHLPLGKTSHYTIHK
ncbi:MAG: porin family protein [Bacteroidales bacterium]|jgi:hypothetical protein